VEGEKHGELDLIDDMLTHGPPVLDVSKPRRIF
jgi:hypothetical protein